MKTTILMERGSISQVDAFPLDRKDAILRMAAFLKAPADFVPERVHFMWSATVGDRTVYMVER